jgi:hypothetical protein
MPENSMARVAASKRRHSWPMVCPSAIGKVFGLGGWSARRPEFGELKCIVFRNGRNDART